MSTDVTIHNPTTEIAEQMKWAQAVVARPDGAAQSIIPEAYRNNPANVLIAVGLGASMGLSFAESLYRISVIKGKPSAAAELIASNVRKAGHKLRIRVTEEPPSATCTIIRADDPDEPTVITRDLAWATRMGLANEPNYKKQPSTMLSWRAISACARLACPEALYGVAYTPDEMDSAPTTDGAPTAERPSASQFMAAEHAAPVVVEDVTQPPGEDVHDAEVVDGPEPITDGQRRAMFAMFAKAGFDTDARTAEGRQARLDYVANAIGRAVESTSDLSRKEAAVVLSMLEADSDGAA